MSDRNIDPADPDLTVGQRIKYYRRRIGMSQAALGSFIGKSESWVKQVERGDLGEPKLSLLLNIAELLRLKDPMLLVGPTMPRQIWRGPGHPALADVRDAINTVSVTLNGPPPPLAHLQARLDAAWRARHAAPDHRTVLGALLPEMIRDAKHAARVYEGADRRRALALLAGVYNLAQFYVAYQPSPDLLWRVVERSLIAAEESEDPRAFAGAVWLATQAHRDAGDFDAAEAVNREGMEILQPRVSDDDDDLRALWGALHHEAAYTAARRGQGPEAWRWWEIAKRVARTLPADYYEPMTSFSAVIMKPHAVTIAVEARTSGEAARQAAQAEDVAIPSQPRRARHLIEVARAWHMAGDKGRELGALQEAYRTAPETIRFNGYARKMTVELAQEPSTFQPEAANLADRIGIMV